MGSVAINAANVVIMIGRNLTVAACTIAFSGVMCCVRSASSAKSIIMIAFFFTIPTSSISPTNP